MRSEPRAQRVFQVGARQCSEKLDDCGKDYLQRSDHAARQIERLVSDLLAYGQLTHVEVTAVPISLDQVVNKVLQDLNPEISPRPVMAGRSPAHESVSIPLAVWPEQRVLSFRKGERII